MNTDFKPSFPWALVSTGSSASPNACLEVDGQLYDLGKTLARLNGPQVPSVLAAVENWEEVEPWLEKAAGIVDEEDLVADEGRLAPVLFPGKVLCAGANYYKHLKEMGVEDLRKESQRLFFFFKPARNAVVGEGATVRMPLDTNAMDWEVEIAAVIGKTARAVSVEDALSHVAAYTVAIDFSARDLNRAPDTFYKLDWVAGKGHDTCCPMGPRLVPASAIGDPGELALRLSVNGEEKQNDTARDMIFSVAEQISTASRIMTLDPGDVLLTGTPAGVGMPKQTFLSVGDQVDAEIENIGKLSVTIQEGK
jgi:2-keto-4-pentenoate hydratase/2-oxohepta-3-ene-1,7-dioic acid hydratase in catechol pathway